MSKSPPSKRPEPRIPASAVVWGFLVVAVSMGLVGSASLLVDYLGPAPIFCDVGGGCEALRETSHARPLGVPLPVVGVLGYVGLGLLLLLPGASPRKLFAWAAALGAVIAGYLLVVQFTLGQICPYCLVVDVAAIAAGGLGFVRAVRGFELPGSRLAQSGGLASIGLALAVPLVASRWLPAKVPDVVAQEILRTPKGQVTIVDFADFECPFCRLLHAELAQVLAKHPGQVRLVRKHVPLTRVHPHALDAARAACCGEALGRGEAFADALFTQDDLSREGCESIASRLGLDLERFRACLTSPQTERRITDDTAMFKSSKARGLPTLWVDVQKIEGATEAADLEAALARALARRS